MATQKLYLYEKTDGIVRLDNSMSMEYSFDGATLRVYWKGSCKQSVKANKGNVFIIRCGGQMPQISQLQLPHNKYYLIMWLCGYSRINAAINRKEFERIAAKNRERLKWWSYQEYGPKSADYSFILATRSDCGGESHVAAYINPKLQLTTDKVIEMLNTYYQVCSSDVPAQFVESTLREKFGMTTQDLLRMRIR